MPCQHEIDAGLYSWSGVTKSYLPNYPPELMRLKEQELANALNTQSLVDAINALPASIAAAMARMNGRLGTMAR